MALIPPFFLDCVVAIGALAPDGERTFWTGTGFLVGRFTGEIDADDARSYHIYLVTNRHVLAGKDSVQVRFNPEGEDPARQFEITLAGKLGKGWFVHPDPEVDVAVVPINPDALDNEKIKYHVFQDDQ